MGDGVIVGVLVGAGVLVGFVVFVGGGVVGSFVGVGVGNCAWILRLSVLALQPGSLLWYTDTLNSPGK